MGARTSPAALQSLADRLFHDLKSSVCAVYLDDIISGAADTDTMITNLALIFERLKIGNLKLKPDLGFCLFIIYLIIVRSCCKRFQQNS